jgi:hypothetical protein
MSEINEHVSIWAKLYKRWEKVESDLRSSGTRPGSEADAPMSAMEVELRALGARVDTAFNDATAARYRKPTSETRDEQHSLSSS